MTRQKTPRRLAQWAFRRMLLVAMTAIQVTDLVASDWTYTAASDEAVFSRPLFRSIPLAIAKPDNVAERVSYRGATQRYAMLRYGTPNSLRVVVVVDEVSRGDFDLYVDSDRDHTIIAEEKIVGSGRLRRMELNSELSHGESGSDMLPRLVVFRRGVTSSTLSFATLGFVQGSVSFDGKQLAARRVDGDGDGLYSGTRDRLWLDLNDDGQWDAFAEQFPYLPILKLNGDRFAVRADLAGKQLALRELSESGTLQLELAVNDRRVQLDAIHVMLVGDDGSAVSLQGTQNAVTVPTGEYRVGTVRVALKDATTKTPWHFVFSDSGGLDGRTFQVNNGQEVTIDPIGRLRFELKRDDANLAVKPGETLSVRPQLYTADGLLINSSHCGPNASPDGGNSAHIYLGNSVGRRPVAQSGFT